MNSVACGAGHKIESERKWTVSHVARDIKLNQDEISSKPAGVTGIVKTKRYSDELILENLTRNLIHKVSKQLKKKIFALYTVCIL